MKIIQQEVAEDRDFIRKKVVEYNNASLPGEEKSPIEQMSFIVRNEAEEIIGGLTATGFWRHLHIDFLWVDPAARGQRIAAKLMAQAEVYARSKGHRLMIVDTLSFQAPEFYKKQGFSEFGAIKDFPEGHSHHYFEKWLTE
ncbi:ribosomal protein S18 acetylase RimI-like enzyme [Planomicrobium stackebrandtii]|uniref:Ribosomal protein S18 acetylase RimI-like enzyme n=1 Tax=Planomicrobium stackebrandtii TaxID=253160 RepID=A0ABU0GX35_9BACL|nr:GNAT family N-acetyltransferase [Planomicrobium stackebrandtii]MDQ0429868.1 ribosomal protein S18 acetylase RimI-like enzyme [Planomicrobium stackebrandtii]